MEIPKPLKSFIDEEGRLTAWPSKHAKKLLAIEFLAQKIPENIDFTEVEINAILKDANTFGDHALLRRELFKKKYLDRTIDGRKYWRIK